MLTIVGSHCKSGVFLALTLYHRQDRRAAAATGESAWNPHTWPLVMGSGKNSSLLACKWQLFLSHHHYKLCQKSERKQVHNVLCSSYGSLLYKSAFTYLERSSQVAIELSMPPLRSSVSSNMHTSFDFTDTDTARLLTVQQQQSAHCC